MAPKLRRRLRRVRGSVHWHPAAPRAQGHVVSHQEQKPRTRLRSKRCDADRLAPRVLHGRSSFTTKVDDTWRDPPARTSQEKGGAWFVAGASTFCGRECTRSSSRRSLALLEAAVSPWSPLQGVARLPRLCLRSRKTRYMLRFCGCFVYCTSSTS
jgi:hypothetical protein